MINCANKKKSKITDPLTQVNIATIIHYIKIQFNTLKCSSRILKKQKKNNFLPSLLKNYGWFKNKPHPMIYNN